MTIAPDGSPIEVYLLFPAAGEAERVHAAIPACATVLDLGCGVGRIAHELIRLGHPVVAVDQSPEMLAHVRGAETVQSSIEELDLGRRFPCVLLARHHPFDALLLDDDALNDELRTAGLRLSGVLDDRGTWVEARLYSGA